MDKVVSGIYEACNALTLIAGAVLVLCLILTGISAMKNGADGKIKLKDDLTYIVMGAALVFSAALIGKAISGWFM